MEVMGCLSASASGTAAATATSRVEELFVAQVLIKKVKPKIRR